ncbi:hypothetical protein FRC09_014192, partial [Ceratobasidium sp. 395]
MSRAASDRGAGSVNEAQPILVEPFIPPPRPPPRRTPTGPRVVVRSPTARQGSYSEDPLRNALVESPSSHDLRTLRSHSSQETLSGRSSQSVSDLGSQRDFLLPPKRRPKGPNVSVEGFHGHLEGSSASSTNDSSPLLSPLVPKRQQSVATQLPTVPIPPSPSDRPQITLGSGFMSRFEPVPVKALVVHTALCFASFPFVYLLCMAASGLSLFWSRAIVGA